MVAERSDFVVIGGGIAGVSTALYLAEEGLGRVLLLERGFLGGGATAFSSGGVRQQFSTPIEIDLSIRSLEFWKSAADRFDAPCVFTETGYLFVTARETVLDRLTQAAKLQADRGADPAYVLGPRDLLDIVPWMHTDDLAGGCWTPNDGRIIPADGIAAIARAARAAGAEIREHFPVTHIRREKGGFTIHGVEDVRAQTVIVAAGLDTPGLLKPLGFDIDIRPWMIHYAYTTPALVGYHLPTTIDLDLGLTVKRDGYGLSLGILDEASTPDSTAQDMLEAFFAAASVRAPILTEVGILRTISAAADLSVDGHPYAGSVEDGLWVLAGFGGHGTMHGPVLAEWLVDGIAGKASPAYLSGFDPYRKGAIGDHEWLVASRKP